MKTNSAVVVTSISPPNEALRALARGCAAHGFRFVVVGDSKSPADFQIDACEFFDLKRQAETGFRFDELCPTGSYARKNIGYLISARANRLICRELENLTLHKGVENLGENLRVCYEKLIGMKLIDQKELKLIDAWLADLRMY